MIIKLSRYSPLNLEGGGKFIPGPLSNTTKNGGITPVKEFCIVDRRDKQSLLI